MSAPDPVYDGLRRRLAGLVGKQPAGDYVLSAEAQGEQDHADR